MSDVFDDAVDSASYADWLDPELFDLDAFDADGDDEVEVGGFADDAETLADRNARLLERNARDRQEGRWESSAPDVLDAQRRDAFDPTAAARARSVLTEAAAGHGLTFGELVAPLPPGRQTAANRERRDVLARAVVRVRRDGVTLHVLATVTGRSLSLVHALEQRGGALCG